ncbi:hypothetical protein [Alicyclobacillus mengziensis]
MPSRKAQTVTTQMPCSIVLNPIIKDPNTRGVALIYRVRHRYSETSSAYQERTSISIHANYLPKPESQGDYDGYEGFAQIPGLISWRFRLLPRQEFSEEPIWAGRFDYISTGLTEDTKVEVRLSNSKTQKLGPAVLQGSLKDCKR